MAKGKGKGRGKDSKGGYATGGAFGKGGWDQGGKSKGGGKAAEGRYVSNTECQKSVARASEKAVAKALGKAKGNGTNISDKGKGDRILVFISVSCFLHLLDLLGFF